MASDGFDLFSAKNELRELTIGGCYKSLYRLLYYVTLLKYVTQKHLKAIGFSGVEKVATKGKLRTLHELGYVRIANQTIGIYTATGKTILHPFIPLIYLTSINML